MRRISVWLAFVVMISALASGVSAAAPRHPPGKGPKAVAPSAARPHTGKHHGHKQPSRGNVAVSVVNQQGRPVAGATVRLRKVTPHKQRAAHAAPRAHAAVGGRAAGAHHAHAHVQHRSGRMATTDPLGRAAFPSVKAEHFRVKAHKKGVGSGHTHAAVQAGQTTSVTIKLARHAPGRRAGAHRGVLNRQPHPQVAPHAPRPPAARKR